MVTEQHIDLTLEELADEVGYALQYYNLLGAHADNRVSPVPDARTIRYYTTLGLLDRPRIQGRQARYGKRQLLQLLAIKALQSHGLPLSDVQARIYGRSESELESMLATMSTGKNVDTNGPVHATVWKEILLEPGLKLMVEDGWSPSQSISEIESKIRAVLKEIENARDAGNGGV